MQALKRDNQLYNWGFTLNNWTEEEHAALVSEFSDEKYLISKEKGKKEETPHLHGYVHLKMKKRFSSMQGINKRVHWEKVRNVRKYIDYVKKDGDFVTNMKIQMPCEYPDFTKQWQLDILSLIKEKPNDRSIYWFWEDTGNVGKTVFTKYLCDKMGGSLIPPKRADAWHAVAQLLEEGKVVDLIVIDIPRHDADYVNYGAIEKIKDGCFASGKYKTATCIFRCPHVIVFANQIPETYKMSADRWIIKQIA